MKLFKKIMLTCLSLFVLCSCASNASVMGANVPNENNTSIDNSMSAPTNSDINLN